MTALKVDTKFFLWLLFCAQILLIGLILSLGTTTFREPHNDCASSECAKEFPVQFIPPQVKDTGWKEKQGIQGIRILEDDLPRIIPALKPIGNPFEAFIHITTGNHSIWCFQEGTETPRKGVQEEKGAAPKCKCKSEWHGADCGQPEVVWRSLFAARAKTSVSTKRQAKNIFYIIQASEHSLETLAIQILELTGIVDAFVICPRNAQSTALIRKYLDKLHGIRGHLERIFLAQVEQCDPRQILSKLSRALDWPLSDDDLVLTSEPEEILNRKAVAYLKWYDDGHDSFRFRLKHLVYGFFWQHPGRTILGSQMVKYKVLLRPPVHQESLVLGDLNHFGGWRCQLCSQPLDIIGFLHYQMQANATFGARHKNGVLDEEFTTKLIANGVNIYELLAREGNFQQATVVGGGPMDLVKLYPSREKYYSPSSVHSSAQGQEFENLVRNQFARWELDVVDDYNYYN